MGSGHQEGNVECVLCEILFCVLLFAAGCLLGSGIVQFVSWWQS